MDISNIKNPEFLKNLSVSDCQVLSNEIRNFLISSISKTGGHLASNLGVVELTVALHKSFNSPTDKIFFDVGHQAYTHKILTGRFDKFSKLRQHDGISGFQKRCESEHDVWEAGHSSTSLSGALGMCISRDLNNESYHVVPVIGDGALSNGMALEALNEIGSESRKMIIIFNDNNMSISSNVGAMSKGFSRLRTMKSYTNMKLDLKNILDKSNVGKSVLKSLTNIKNTVKDSIVDKGIFKEFNIDYLGPIDGHNINELLKAFDTAKKHDGPIVIHVLTKKGKGYEFCEKDTNGFWHGIGPFNIETGKPISSNNGNLIPYSKIMSDALYELCEKDENIVTITPAMINGSKLEKLFAKYPKRCFDVGIAEEHGVTMACGLALTNKKPVVCIYSSFLQRAYDQLNHDVCRMNLPVTFIIDRAGLVGEDGATHHGVFDISFMRSLPNIIMSQPKDATEARNLLFTALTNNKNPFSIRIPRGSTIKSDEKFNLINIGSWEIFNNNLDNKVIVFTYGNDVDIVLNKVIINKLNVTVVNCRFFKPLDEKILKEMFEKDAHYIVYETDVITGGLSSSILEWLNDNNINKKIDRIGIEDKFIEHGSNNHLRKSCKIDTNTLFEIIHKYL